jgi:hypothetical protein
VDGSARLEKGRKQRKQRGVRNLELIGISQGAGSFTENNPVRNRGKYRIVQYRKNVLN